jgi:hypothetical protein
MNAYSFDTVLEIVEEMSDDEQLTLIDLIRKRQTEKRRDEIARNIVLANEDYIKGNVFRGSVDEIMGELTVCSV